MSVAEVVATVLAEGPASVPDVVSAVRRAGGHGVSRAAIERTLAADGRFEVEGAADPRRPRWQLAPPEPADAPDGGDPGRTRAALDSLALRDWQVEAFAAWSAAGCRGVVEAVTGTGKTRLAIAVLRTVLHRGGRGLVIVPTLELLEQWVRELRAALPDARLGRLGGGHGDDLFACDVVVATPHSAAAVPVDLPPGTIGVLDRRRGPPLRRPDVGRRAPRRVHPAPRADRHLRARRRRRRRRPRALLRGGRHALPVRPRGGRRDGRTVPHRAGRRRAHRRRTRALRPRRRTASASCTASWSVPTGMPKDPRGAGSRPSPPSWRRRTAPAGTARRSRPAASTSCACVNAARSPRTASGKLAVCAAVAPALAGRRTPGVHRHRRAGRGRGRGSCPGPVATPRPSTATCADDKRRIRLALFRRGDLEVLVAPRVLDEGVDVPDADVAVVLAAFRTRRQMVQRLGRVLRVEVRRARGTAAARPRGRHRGGPRPRRPRGLPRRGHRRRA